MPKYRPLAALLMAGGVLLAGCSSEESQPDAEAAVCASLLEVSAAVDQVKALNAGSTIDDADAAREALDEALSDLRSSAQDVTTADTAAVEAGVDTVKQAIDDVSGSDSLAEAAGSVVSSTADLESAIEEMNNGLQCM